MAGADVMRRSHTASVPEEVPVTHRCGREGCTAKQLIRLDIPCTSILSVNDYCRTTTAC